MLEGRRCGNRLQQLIWGTNVNNVHCIQKRSETGRRSLLLPDIYIICTISIDRSVAIKSHIIHCSTLTHTINRHWWVYSVLGRLWLLMIYMYVCCTHPTTVSRGILASLFFLLVVLPRRYAGEMSTINSFNCATTGQGSSGTTYICPWPSILWSYLTTLGAYVLCATHRRQTKK